MVKNIYWEETAAMQVDGEVCSFKKNMKRGVRQGCMLSPDLSSLYSELIMRKLEGYPGNKVGGYEVNKVRYTDDTVLIAENKEDLQQILDIVEEEEPWSGKLNPF